MKEKLLKNTIIYGIGNIAQKGLSFLLVFLYTHYLTASEIGIINTTQVFTAVYALLLSFGLERSIYRLYYDYKTEESKKIFLGNITIAILFVSIILIGISLTFIDQISFLIEESNFSTFIYLGIADAFFTTITIIPKLVFQVKEKSISFISITLGAGLLNVTIIFIAIYLGYRDAYYVLIASLLSYILFIPINIIILYKNCIFKIDFSIIKSALKYSLPLLPSLISSWVINMSDRFFLKYYYSFSEVGYYSVVYKLGQVVQLFATALLMAYTPHFYSRANASKVDEKSIIKTHNQNLYYLLFICFFIAFISDDFIAIALTPEYLDYSYLVPIVVLGYFFIQMTGFQNISFYQTKKTLKLMWLNIIAAIINITLNFIFIKHLGMLGAAISTVITQFIFFVLTYYISTKIYILRIELIRISLLLLLLGTLVVISSKYHTPGLIGIIIKISLIVVTLFFIFRKKLFEKEKCLE